MKKLLTAMRGAGVLTVGETSDFLKAGGIVSFSCPENARVFDINLAAATEARLKISPRLLGLARHVVTAPGASP